LREANFKGIHQAGNELDQLLKNKNKLLDKKNEFQIKQNWQMSNRAKVIRVYDRRIRFFFKGIDSVK
jgi:hypothetical protein